MLKDNFSFTKVVVDTDIQMLIMCSVIIVAMVDRRLLILCTKYAKILRVFVQSRELCLKPMTLHLPMDRQGGPLFRTFQVLFLAVGKL